MNLGGSFVGVPYQHSGAESAPLDLQTNLLPLALPSDAPYLPCAIALYSLYPYSLGSYFSWTPCFSSLIPRTVPHTALHSFPQEDLLAYKAIHGTWYSLAPFSPEGPPDLLSYLGTSSDCSLPEKRPGSSVLPRQDYY